MGLTASADRSQLIDGLDLLSRGVVSELEALALFLACLCHDLDHRGTNNTFQGDKRRARNRSTDGCSRNCSIFQLLQALQQNVLCNV